jgi:hypothetical protein
MKSVAQMKQSQFSKFMDMHKGWWRWQAKYLGCANER